MGFEFVLRCDGCGRLLEDRDQVQISCDDRGLLEGRALNAGWKELEWLSKKDTSLGTWHCRECARVASTSSLTAEQAICAPRPRR